jgi:hypothetical protein
MTSIIDGCEHLRRKLIRLANISVAKGGGVDEARRMIAEHDLVVAVWQDYTKTHGLGFLVLKGNDALLRNIETDVAATLKINAIPARNAAEGQAMQ